MKGETNLHAIVGSDSTLKSIVAEAVAYQATFVVAVVVEEVALTTILL